MSTTPSAPPISVLTAPATTSQTTKTAMRINSTAIASMSARSSRSMARPCRARPRERSSAIAAMPVEIADTAKSAPSIVLSPQTRWLVALSTAPV